MSNPFEALGINVPQIVADHIPGVPATLTVVTPGTRTVGALASGTNPTETDYACRGWVETVTKVPSETGSHVQVTERIVVLMLATIAGGTVTPKKGDKVTIDGLESKIERVTDIDPAEATITMVVHG